MHTQFPTISEALYISYKVLCSLRLLLYVEDMGNLLWP